MNDLRTAAQQALEALGAMNPYPASKEDQRASALAALRAALAQQDESVQEPVATLIAQRDALLEALKSTGLFLHHCWCDVQMNDHSFEKLNRQMEIVDAAIKAVEGEKA